MMCYKDITFCAFWRTCAKGGECPRKLSSAVVADADAKELPIAQFSSLPDCYQDGQETINQGRDKDEGTVQE